MIYGLMGEKVIANTWTRKHLTGLPRCKPVKFSRDPRNHAQQDWKTYTKEYGPCSILYTVSHQVTLNKH